MYSDSLSDTSTPGPVVVHCRLVLMDVSCTEIQDRDGCYALGQIQAAKNNYEEALMRRQLRQSMDILAISLYYCVSIPC